MTVNTLSPILYEQDFALWIEKTVSQLKAGDFAEIDLENLIEEVESLGRQDKRELENRLKTLLEHALKRRYVLMPDCYRGDVLLTERFLAVNFSLITFHAIAKVLSYCFTASSINELFTGRKILAINYIDF
ncbi:MAG: DUF29 domain-containing protein [Snowella sp.]|nr:DUF29 domain-containing protein [Snowella sp.]